MAGWSSHAVTLESEAVLLAAFDAHGGELQRISVETAQPVGPFHGWKPSMPVTQWAWTKTTMTGTLYGLGVGPGDPELLTLKAHRILTACPVVAYPAPDTGESFARSIVAGYLSPYQLEIPIVVPMRVERFPAAEVYDRAADEIAGHLDAGATWRWSARATRSSTAPSCTCSSGWGRVTGPRSCRAFPR